MNEAEPTRIVVTDEPERHRFVVEQDGERAELVYRLRGKRFILVHTGVPDALDGRGIGSSLVQAAIARAVEEQLIVVPWCPFARQWLRNHPEIAAGVTIDWTPPPSGSEAR